MGPDAALRRFPLFRVLGPEALAGWLAQGEQRSVELGDTLFQAGTPGRDVFLVLEGRVRVARPTSAGREVSLGSLGPGDVFGEYALLPPGLNTATCRAGGRGRLLRLPLAGLAEALLALPGVQERLKNWLRLHALLGYLRERTFLGFLSASSLLPLLERCEMAQFAAGETIQADGLCADRWFVVQRGTARLQDGAALGPGDCFGEAALLGRDLPLVEAGTEIECLSLSRAAFTQPLSGPAPSVLQTQRDYPAPHAAFPWVGQEQANDCGAAALAMIARFHGQGAACADLRPRLRLEARGSSLHELQQAAASLGFRAQVVRITPAHLDQVALPAIAHQAGDHYVVLYALAPAGIVVGDPARAVLTVPAAAFQSAWTGYLLLLSPGGQRAQGPAA